MNRLRNVVLTAGLAGVVAAGTAGAAEGKKPIKPRDGTYAGKVTKGNGTGAVTLTVGLLGGQANTKPYKGVSLNRWTGTMTCADGSTQGVGVAIGAKRRGLRFSSTAKSPTQTIKFSGRFTASTKLTGTVSATIDGGTPRTQCQSGPIAFSAKLKK
jgi:hypothetical protein